MIVQLETLSTPQLQNLQKAVRGKKIFLIVHPFYLNWENPFFRKFLQSEAGRNSFLIVAESVKDKEKTKRILAAHKGENQTIYTYSTEENSSQPIIGWQRLIRKLELAGLGGKEITVSGDILGLEKRALFLQDLAEIQSSQKRLKRDAEAKEKYHQIKKNKERVKASLRFIRNRKRKSAGYGCAGFTGTKLGSTNLFKIRLSKRFSR